MPYTKDIILAIAFLIYPFLLLIISKGLDKTGIRKDYSRKFVHVSMGLVILFVPFFDNIWLALLPPVVFTIINLADLYWGIFSQIQGEDSGNVGTVLYPVSFIILIALFFHSNLWGLAVLGIFTMAFGDAGASIIGREFGHRKYIVSGEIRSYEGSVGMFIITFIVAIGVFAFSGSDLGMSANIRSLFAASFIIAGIATIIEALSVRGSDNITVPVLTALAAWALIAVFMPHVLGNQSIVQQPLFQ